MRRSVFFCMFLGVFLSSCASTSIPESKTALPVPSTSITGIADYAQIRADSFRTIAQEIKRDDMLMDGGLLAAAAGAAAALFYVNPPAQANAVAGIGIGAGGLSAWKGRLSAKEAAKAYEDASLQLVCVSKILIPVQTVATQKVGGTDSIETRLSDGISNLQEAAADARPAIAAAQSSEIVSKGEELLKASDALSLLALKTVDVLKNANRYGHAQVVSIETDLSGKLNGESIDYSSLRDSLVASIKSKAESEANLPSATATTAVPSGPAGLAVKPDDVAKVKMNELSDSLAQLRQYHSLAQGIQDAKADLDSCRAK